MAKSNVIVDAESKNVSCFFWPSFSHMTPKERDIYYITENTMRSNVYEESSRRQSTNRLENIYEDYGERKQLKPLDRLQQRNSMPLSYNNSKFKLAY